MIISSPPGANKSLSNLTNLGNSGQVLTSNGAGAAPTFQAAGGGAPVEMIISTDMSNSTRFVNGDVGGGTNTWSGDGLDQNTSATISSGTKSSFTVLNNTTGNISLGSPQISICVEFRTTGTDFQEYFGIEQAMAVTGGAIDFTKNHIGFKVIRSASGTINVYATQGNGTTETASASLATLTAGGNESLDLVFKVNSTTSVDYYYRKTDGALSSATNITSNMPTAANGLIRITSMISNNGVATASQVYVTGMCYRR